jgi:hypothetical protein
VIKNESKFWSFTDPEYCIPENKDSPETDAK